MDEIVQLQSGKYFKIERIEYIVSAAIQPGLIQDVGFFSELADALEYAKSWDGTIREGMTFSYKIIPGESYQIR